MVQSLDVLEFTLKSYYGGSANQGLNVFQYQVVTPEPFGLALNGQELCEGIYAHILSSELRAIISSQVAYNGFSIKNLSEPLEIFEGVPNEAIVGDVAGDCLPPYAAYGFKLTRTTALTRNGAKRFWGVPESMQVNGQPGGLAIVNLPLIAQNLAFGFDFDLVIEPVENVQFYPAIVRKDAAGLMTQFQRVLSAQFRSITTQNTRKFGRGM